MQSFNQIVPQHLYRTYFMQINALFRLNNITQLAACYY